MEIEKLNKFNEWWTFKRVSQELLKPYKRQLFYELFKFLSDRQILLVMGLRRVGKTTLLYQIIQELLERKTNPLNILYFSFDEESAEVEDVLETYREKILKKSFRQEQQEKPEKIYVLFDEIQKVKDWQNKLKIYYDLYPQIKFFISGSASVSLQKKSKESLAGRIYDLTLSALSFKEFLDLKGIKVETERIEIYKNTVMPLFFDYLRKGGFPEIVDEADDKKIKLYVKNNVIERIIYRDLPSEFGLRDSELLKTLIEIVSKNPGMILNYDKLSKDLKRNKKTIIDYFHYLEYAMLFRLVYNYRKGFLVSSRKLKKVYPTNSALSFSFVDNFYSEAFLEKVVESIVINWVDARNYYRNKYEIDIIIKKDAQILPIEIKYGGVEARGMMQFLKEFDIKKGLIITKDLLKKETKDNKKISFVPVWAFIISKEEFLKS